MNKTDKLIELERPPIVETAVLVRLALPRDSEEEIAESLEEMRRLAWTAGAKIGCTFVQYRPSPHPGMLIGSGKAEEVKQACQELEADMAIFDSDLTPAQGSNLERILGQKVVDRTQLILDIFGQRAQTNEAKNQVELAQLQYLLPRLKGRGSVMRQQGGIGVRGPGEQKLEVDRRLIRKRIERLRAGIESARQHRRLQRKRRSQGNVSTVALVGYTNAGKSSLLNALSGADVFVEDKLFATLDPRVRQCTLPSQRPVVFADTVGFIRKLPHSLVAAFRSTLEEVNNADLLLLVADASHPAVMEHMQAVREVLEEINALKKPVLHVFNKMDVSDVGDVHTLAPSGAEVAAVSALTGAGLDNLMAAIDKTLVSTRHRVTLRIPHSEAGLVARIHDSGRVLSQEYNGDCVMLEAEIDAALAGQVADYVV